MFHREMIECILTAVSDQAADSDCPLRRLLGLTGFRSVLDGTSEASATCKREGDTQEESAGGAEVEEDEECADRSESDPFFASTDDSSSEEDGEGESGVDTDMPGKKSGNAGELIEEEEEPLADSPNSPEAKGCTGLKTEVDRGYWLVILSARVFFLLRHRPSTTPIRQHRRLMDYSSTLKSIWQDVRSEDSPAPVLLLSFAIIVALFRYRNSPNIVLALSLFSLTEALVCSNPSFINLTDFSVVVPRLLPEAYRVAWLLLFIAAPALVQSVLGLALLIRSTWRSFDDLAQARVRAEQIKSDRLSSSSTRLTGQNNVPRQEKKSRAKEL